VRGGKSFLYLHNPIPPNVIWICHDFPLEASTGVRMNHPVEMPYVTASVKASMMHGQHG
jgi:hypothetical protein